MYKANLKWQPIAILIVLSMIWGANMASIKIGGRELPPLFQAGVRSAVASLCLYIWMKAKGVALFPSRAILAHGIVTGFLFGAEFAFAYVGLKYTLASRGYVLLYTAPFFAAIGAHLFLVGDRFNSWKAVGLLLAFCGVVALFIKELGAFSFATLPGDLMMLLGGAVWGATTIYIKKYMVHRAEPLQIIFYQLVFSAPMLLIMSFALEDIGTFIISMETVIALFYQSIIVAFISYLIWFHLVSRYPVSLVHAFSFFTPVFGVFFSGLLILGEVISPNLILALVLVSLGMVLVNHQPAGEG
jgi:drug/metabolite transporter (DMT)-like permease